VRSCGKIGAVRVVGESAIAAGVRRIEAVSGPALAEWCQEEMRKQEEKWEGLAKRKAGIVPLSRESRTIPPEQAWDLVKKREQELAKAEEAIREEDKQAAKKLTAEWQRKAEAEAKEVWGLGVVVGGVRWIGKDLGEVATGYLPVLADRLKKEGEAVVFLAGRENGKVPLLAACTAEAAKKVPAGKLIQAAAPEVGGKGGGRPDAAQGSGTNPEGIAKALAAAEMMVKAALGGGS
jgi:alanyl-tRNA synthetase